MKRLEHLLHTHPGKTIVVVKLTPFLALPGLMTVGATRFSIKRFISVCSLIIFPKVIIFMVLGYYFGHVYDSISHYVQNAEYFIILAIALILVAHYSYKRLTTLISQRIETI